MINEFLWHYNDDEYITFAKQYIKELKQEFNYRDFITPYSEERELVGAIIEEFQYLESNLKHLLFCATEHNIYSGDASFDFDKYISATTIVIELKDILIEAEIADELKSLIKFRNYIIHSHYTNVKRKEKLEYFPIFLFKIYGANEYISNVINRIIGGATHTPNIFETKWVCGDFNVFTIIWLN